MKNDEFIQEENPQVKLKSNKTIKIIISIIVLIVGVGLVYFGYNSFINKDNDKKEENNKTNSLITKDTWFLCPGENDDSNGILKLVTVSDNKHENEVCDGKFAGKYVCENSKCSEPNGGQFFSGYINFKDGIAIIYDTNDELNYLDYSFMYDFKNNKKISDNYNFSNIIYLEDDIKYFRVEKEKKVGVINSKGETIIPISYDDVGLYMFDLESETRQFAAETGVAITYLNNKFGLYDMANEKEVLSPDYEHIGPVLYDGDGYRMFIGYIYNIFFNKKLKQIYAVSNQEAKIINYETGEVIKKLDKVYDYAYPINEDFTLTISNDKIDILENNKSVLTEKLDSKNSFYLHYEKASDANSPYIDSLYGDFESNIFYIEINLDNEGKAQTIYKFDTTTKKLTKS